MKAYKAAVLPLPSTLTGMLSRGAIARSRRRPPRPRDLLSRNEAFFRTGLAAMKGPKVVALEGSRIVGLLHSVDSPDCQFSGPEKLRMTPAMIGGFGLRSALRVSSWLSAWSKHDPSGPHSHLGPIGVEPA